MNPEEVYRMTDVVVVISARNVMDMAEQMAANGMKFCVWYSHKFYCFHDNWRLFNYNLPAEVYSVLNSKKLILCGEEKHREDIKYIFSDVRFEQEISGFVKIENAFYILCENKLQIEGMQYEKDYLFAEDLFCLLDEEYIGNSGKIPSLMMKETYYAPMVDQKICTSPFWHAQIDSAGGFHFCCPDFATRVGDTCTESLERIWNSPAARIFRLSLINKTYCFCNENRCIELTVNPQGATERMRDVPETKKTPSSFEIGIDKTCNLFCKSCRDHVIVENGKRKENIEKSLKSIFESGWLEQVDELLLGGQGEVFFSDVYRKIMFSSIQKRKLLDLRTNGTLLSEQEFQAMKEKYHKLRIYVSVDSYDKDTYSELRRSKNPDTYERLMENLQMLAQKRREGDLDFFQVNMCVQAQNYREIPQFLQYSYDLGVDSVQLLPIRNWGTYTPEEFEKITILDEQKKLKPEVKEVIENTYIDRNRTQIGFSIQ